MGFCRNVVPECRILQECCCWSGISQLSGRGSFCWEQNFAEQRMMHEDCNNVCQRNDLQYSIFGRFRQFIRPTNTWQTNEHKQGLFRNVCLVLDAI